MTGRASYLYLIKEPEFTPWLSLQSSSEATAYSLVYWGFCKCIYLLCISLIISASLPSPAHPPNSNPQLSKPSLQPLPLRLHYCGPLITLPLPTAFSLQLCVGTLKLHPGEVMMNSILTYSLTQNLTSIMLFTIFN